MIEVNEANQAVPLQIYLWAIGALIAFVVFLIGIIGYFYKGDRQTTQEMLKNAYDILGRLVTNDAVKTEQINNLGDDIEGIKKVVFPVYHPPNRKRNG
jgi:hypothetical protein